MAVAPRSAMGRQPGGSRRSARFASQANGVSGNVTITDLRLTGIAYDNKTLRVIANANGAVNVAISSLAQ